MSFISFLVKFSVFAVRVATFFPGLVLKMAFGGSHKDNHARNRQVEKKESCCCGGIGKILLLFAVCAIISVVVTKLVKHFHCKKGCCEDDCDCCDDDCFDDDCCDDKECCDDDCCEDGSCPEGCCQDEECQK